MTDNNSIANNDALAKDMRTRGCPACYHIWKNVFEFFSHWIYVLANDEKIQSENADALGLCPFHTWQLVAIGSPQGISKGEGERFGVLCPGFDLRNVGGSGRCGVPRWLKQAQSGRLPKNRRGEMQLGLPNWKPSQCRRQPVAQPASVQEWIVEVVRTAGIGRAQIVPPGQHVFKSLRHPHVHLRPVELCWGLDVRGDHAPKDFDGPTTLSSKAHGSMV